MASWRSLVGSDRGEWASLIQNLGFETMKGAKMLVGYVVLQTLGAAGKEGLYELTSPPPARCSTAKFQLVSGVRDSFIPAQATRSRFLMLSTGGSRTPPTSATPQPSCEQPYTLTLQCMVVRMSAMTVRLEQLRASGHLFQFSDVDDAGYILQRPLATQFALKGEILAGVAGSSGSGRGW
jgi:hypothetical protein